MIFTLGVQSDLFTSELWSTSTRASTFHNVGNLRIKEASLIAKLHLQIIWRLELNSKHINMHILNTYLSLSWK